MEKNGTGRVESVKPVYQIRYKPHGIAPWRDTDEKGYASAEGDINYARRILFASMVEVKLDTLKGPALRWVVAQIEGLAVELAAPHYGTGWRVFLSKSGYAYRPDIDWSQGGPLLDKYAGTFGMVQGRTPSHYRCFAVKPGPEGFKRIAGGETILIALCKALVRLHHGDEVLVPEVLANAA